MCGVDGEIKLCYDCGMIGDKISNVNRNISRYLSGQDCFRD